MYFLEKIASKFLIWRLKVDYGDLCNTLEDWEDGEILHNGGCWACKMSFVRKCLEEHIEIK